MQVDAALTGSNFVKEITGLPFQPYLVDIDSSGRVFVDGENDVWRSVDNGASWKKVLDGYATSSRGFLLFVDSRDYIYASILKSGGSWSIYRSTNHGDNWTEILTPIPLPWHMDEAPNGDLYFNSYAGAILYRSTDQGQSFSVWRNITGQVTHYHSVRVAPNGWVWAGAGDGADSRIERYNGSAWTTIASGTRRQPTDFAFDANFAYLAPDAYYEVWRIPLTGTWEDRNEVFNVFSYGEANWMFDAETIGDIMLFGTERGQLWGTWDGERWVKIWESESLGSIFRISQRQPIYYVDRTSSRLFRASVQKTDLIQLFYSQFNAKRGSLTNTESFVLEQRLWSGTNYIDLTKMALSNVQASIKGLSRYSYVAGGNSGFEWNNKTNWIESGAPRGAIVTDDKANGAFSYKVIKSSSDATFSGIIGASLVNMNRGDVVIFSAYMKANIRIASATTIVIYNHTSNKPLKSSTFDLTTSWQRIVVSYPSTVASIQVRPQVQFNKVNATMYLDSVMFQSLEVGIDYYESTTADSTAFLELHQPPPYFENEVSTLNPVLDINGQIVSYTGALINGSASPIQSLSGNFTGAIKVTATIQGSNQAILRITGTRIVYGDSIIILERKDTVYYGRYHGTPSLTTTTSDLIALTNLASNITTLSYDGSKLNLTINAPLGMQSITKVYVGEKGKPKTVHGATGWSYDSRGKILTIIKQHSSLAEITVDWTKEIPTSIANQLMIAIPVAFFFLGLVVAIGALLGGMNRKKAVLILIAITVAGIVVTAIFLVVVRV